MFQIDNFAADNHHNHKRKQNKSTHQETDDDKGIVCKTRIVQKKYFIF